MRIKKIKRKNKKPNKNKEKTAENPTSGSNTLDKPREKGLKN